MTSTLPHHVLHATQDHTIFLLDLPASIADAQYPSILQSQCPAASRPYRTRTLVSRPAPRTPYPTNEPVASRTDERKEGKGTENSQSDAEAVLHALYAKLVREALEEVRARLDKQRWAGEGSQWCLPRTLGERSNDNGDAGDVTKQEQSVQGQGEKAGEKKLKRARESSGPDVTTEGGTKKQEKNDEHIAERQRDDGEIDNMAATAIETTMGNQGAFATEERRLTDLLAYGCARPASVIASSEPTRDEEDHEDRGEDEDVDEDVNLPSHHNASEHPLTLHLSSRATRESVTSPNPSSFAFAIPPYSAFVLGDVTQTVPALRTTLRALSPRTHGRADWLLLDPPWPNRSALRSRAYRPQYSVEATTRLLRRLDLDACIAPAGHVGVWVTNRASCRAAVLRLFEEWNVELVEEWVLAKVTCGGEPVTVLGGTWRRPYEVLLIGRKPGDAMAVVDSGLRSSSKAAAVDGVDQVRRRVLAAVPDLHSRKPCLKWLVERLLVRREGYVGVEVFARHLVAGWLSWGNEVLKYNWLGYWRDVESNDDESVVVATVNGASWVERATKS